MARQPLQLDCFIIGLLSNRPTNNISFSGKIGLSYTKRIDRNWGGSANIFTKISVIYKLHDSQSKCYKFITAAINLVSYSNQAISA